MIAREYNGEKSENIAEILKDSVDIYSNDPSGLYVKFDKTPTQVTRITFVFQVNLALCGFQILKRDIHIPEILNIDIGQLVEYPPRLSIAVQTTPAFTSPEIQVDGLDRKCGFNLIPIQSKRQYGFVASFVNMFLYSQLLPLVL